MGIRKGMVAKRAEKPGGLFGNDVGRIPSSPPGKKRDQAQR